MRYLFFTILLLPLHSAFAFTDVPKDHPHSEAIYWAKEKGIVEGYPDKTFRPDEYITRAEFLKVLLEAKNPPEENCTNDKVLYSDVDKNAWYTPYITKATHCGIANGYPDGSFRPERYVTYAEAAKMIVATLGKSAIIKRLSLDKEYSPSIQFESNYFGRQWYSEYTFLLGLYVPTSVVSHELKADKQLRRSSVLKLLWYTPQNTGILDLRDVHVGQKLNIGLISSIETSDYEYIHGKIIKIKLHHPVILSGHYHNIQGMFSRFTLNPDTIPIDLRHYDSDGNLSLLIYGLYRWKYHEHLQEPLIDSKGIITLALKSISIPLEGDVEGREVILIDDFDILSFQPIYQ